MKLKKFLPLLVSATFFLPAHLHAAPMTLSVHEADLRSTIMLVAKTGGLNVSIDGSIKGKISVSFNDIDPIKALEIIAKTRNLKLVNEDGIFIFTSEHYTSIMQTYVFPIRYGNAEALRRAVIMSLDNDKKPDDDNDDDSIKRNSHEYESASRTRYKANPDGSIDVLTNAFSNSFYGEKESDNNSSDDKNISRVKRVYVNPEVNALILFGTPAEYERVKNLLATLDVELKQVSVEAKILAINKDATKNLGVEWMWSTVPQYPDREIEVNETSTGRVIVTEEYTRKANDNTGYGIIQFGRGPAGIPFEFYYGAKINALVTNGKAKILSRPNVTTIQGREAVINVGSSVPVPTTQTTNSIVTTSFEYRDAGIILKYTPRINADGTITATIHTEVSTPQYVADLKAYRFNTRSADTTVTVRDGEPMVIGGLIGAEEEKAVSKIPFLGDLPILGALFRNHRKSKSESELIIFLTAHVIGNEVDNPFTRRNNELSDKS